MLARLMLKCRDRGHTRATVIRRYLQSNLDIRASWLHSEINTGNINPSWDAWARHWSTCCSEAAAADVVLLYARKDKHQMGTLLEAGAALGAGKQVWCVSPHRWSFRHHPLVRNFTSLEDAVTAAMAAKAGEPPC